SKEGRAVAAAIQQELTSDCDPVIWDQGAFGLNEGTLDSLVRNSEEFDFALLVLTPDDVIESRGTEQLGPRDNILFELGLFMGRLGKERTFIVIDKTSQIKLPSDLAGVSVASFERQSSGNLRASVGSACTTIREAVSKFGRRIVARNRRIPQVM